MHPGILFMMAAIFTMVAWLAIPDHEADPRSPPIPGRVIALALLQYHSAVLGTYSGTTPAAGGISPDAAHLENGQTFAGFSACTDGTTIASYEDTNHGETTGDLVAALTSLSAGATFGIAWNNAITTPWGASVTLPCLVPNGTPIILTRLR